MLNIDSTVIFYTVIAVIIILVGFIISMFFINRITLFLDNKKMNKTVILLIHLVLISLAFRMIYNIFNTIIPQEVDIYVTTALFVSVFIGSSSNFIRPYFKSLNL